MTLRNLKYFCAAYESGSTVAAARQCHVTQPVISNAIAQLEEELGTRLFKRQQRGLEPTAAAIRLFRLGGKLLADAQAIVETFQDAATHPRLSLSLRILPSLSVAWRGWASCCAIFGVNSCISKSTCLLPTSRWTCK